MTPIVPIQLELSSMKRIGAVGGKKYGWRRHGDVERSDLFLWRLNVMLMKALKRKSGLVGSSTETTLYNRE